MKHIVGPWQKHPRDLPLRASREVLVNLPQSSDQYPAAPAPSCGHLSSLFLLIPVPWSPLFHVCSRSSHLVLSNLLLA